MVDIERYVARAVPNPSAGRREDAIGVLLNTEDAEVLVAGENRLRLIANHSFDYAGCVIRMRLAGTHSVCAPLVGQLQQPRRRDLLLISQQCDG